MTPIKVLVVEDQSLIAESLRALLTKFGMSVSDLCRSGEQAIDAVKTKEPDLIVMDIDLAGAMDGISAAQVISKDRAIPIIYLTDLKDEKTVQRAKQTHPASYMTKPFNEADLVRAIDFAFHNANHIPSAGTKKTPITFIRTDSQTYTKIDLQKIVYLKANRAYCILVTEEGEKTMSTNMNHVHEQINHPDFVRIHRSFVVNMTKVTGIDGNVVKLGKHEAQMSSDYRDGFMKRIKVLR